MNKPLFPNGIKGLADSKWSSYEGECDKLVGIDFRSTPGVIKAHQKLTKNSSTTVTDLCKNVVELSDGTKLWFSSESGKIWKQVGDTFTLVHTMIPATDYKERNSIVAGLEDIPEYKDIESGITMSIAENSAGYGHIPGNNISTFDANASDESSSCKLQSGILSVAYKGVDNDGFIKLFQVTTSSGVYEEIDSLEHDTSEGSQNSLCRIDDTHLMLAYESLSTGIIKTFSGPYSLVQMGNLTHESTQTTYNSLIQIDATHYALSYLVEDKPYTNLLTSSGWTLGGGFTGDYNTGFIKNSSGTTPGVVSSFVPTVGKTYEVSFTISNLTAYDVQFQLGGFDSVDYATNGDFSFQTTATTTAPFSFYADNTAGRMTVSNIQIKELKNGGIIKIFTIDGSYNITEINSTWFNVGEYVYGNKLVLVDSTHIMLSYSDSSANLILKVYALDGSYNITEVESLTHTISADYQHNLIQFDATHYILAGSTFNRGVVKVFQLDGSYQLTEIFALDIKRPTNSCALLKNDENHIVLSGNNFVKVFEINSSYVLKELTTLETDAYGESSIIRDGRRIVIPGYGRVNALTMNETYSNGIILKPSGTEEIKLIASKVVSQYTGVSQYLNTTIKIPEGYSNLCVVIIAGRASSDTYPSVGATVEGVSAIQIVSRTTTYGFMVSSAFYYKVNPATGDNDIVIDFGARASYMYANVLIFANVHQTAPHSTTYDYGWKDYLQLPGSTKNELRLGAFLTKLNTHYSGDLQKEVTQENIAETTDRYTISVSMRKFGIGTAKTLGASIFSYEQTEVIGDEDQSYVPAEQKQKVYYANEDILFAVPINRIDSWGSSIETIGEFRIGDDTYHNMVKQNLELYIGDNTVVSKVNTDGDFVPETALNIMAPERIQVLSAYDTDLLIGTKNINKARVLRWDTFSDSWIADDDVMETGINAFILDDDYTYVSAGDFGHLYFYNGEKLNITKNIPGDWDATHTAKINSNSVGYLKGVPVFGLSNITGNPTLQGIYGFGGYDVRYPKALSLDFPLPTNEFSGVEIGAININGSNMYVSYKTGTDVGVAKLDNSNKYNNAYLETALIGSLIDRDDYSIHEGICIDYISLPANTSISLSTKTKYQTTYTDQDVVPDPDKLSIKTNSSIPDVLNLQAKINLVSDGNNSPLIENIGIL